jgi:hypothetical protein
MRSPIGQRCRGSGEFSPGPGVGALLHGRLPASSPGPLGSGSLRPRPSASRRARRLFRLRLDHRVAAYPRRRGYRGLAAPAQHLSSRPRPHGAAPRSYVAAPSRRIARAHPALPPRSDTTTRVLPWRGPLVSRAGRSRSGLGSLFTRRVTRDARAGSDGDNASKTGSMMWDEHWLTNAFVMSRLEDHPASRTADLPYRGGRPGHQDQEHPDANRVAGHIVIGDGLLALMALSVNPRSAVRLGPRPHPVGGPVGKTHRVGDVRLLVAVGAPATPPQPNPRASDGAG